MKILGISGSFVFNNNDTSAALLIDGKLVSNYEEERFVRVKHSVGHNFPYESIKRILNENNLTIDDIDAIGIPHDTANPKGMAEQIVKSIDPSSNHKPKLFYKDHHTNHACDSFFQSGFKSAAVVVIDGSGDIKDGISIFHIKDNQIKDIKRWSVMHSLGVMYNRASVYTGFGIFGDGKLMGLSSYGKPSSIMPYKWENGDIVSEIPIDNVKENSIRDRSLFLQECESLMSLYYIRNYYPYYKMEEGLTQDTMYYQDFAATIQQCFNNIMFEVCKYAKEMTGEDNLVLSGGCIQNCIGNNIVVESGLFKNVFAGPAPYDAGCAAGLAFYTALQMGETIINNRLTNSYVGKTYGDEEILSSIDNSKYEIKEYSPKKIIKMIEKGLIGAWFQGGSEIGPRALGHRSIIANPKYRNNLNTINTTIKHRENWRPLAPSIPEELFYEVFDTNSKDLTEFMLRTITIKPEWRKKLIAVCHIDNTTRPQTVSKNDNPEFYELIMQNYNLTGIPAIINTSFNGRGEPIIETPQQAMNFMERTPNLSFVVFNAKYIITRKEEIDAQCK